MGNFKKIGLSAVLFSLLGSYSFANISITKTVETNVDHGMVKEVPVSLPKEVAADIQQTIQKNWDDVIKHPGEATVMLFINARKGRIEKGVIVDKEGNKEFFKDFRVFISSLRNLRFKRIAGKPKVLQVTINLVKKNATNSIHDPLSPLKDRGNKVYKEYLELMMKNKGYTKEVIKKILESKKRTITKTMLLAIYYDYIKNDPEKAKLYYETAWKYKPKRFIRSEEGVYLADWFLRQGKEDVILDILPKRTCEFFNDDYRYLCFYYQGRAMYDLNIPGFELPINQAKYHVYQATVLWKDRLKKKKPTKKPKVHKKEKIKKVIVKDDKPKGAEK